MFGSIRRNLYRSTITTLFSQQSHVVSSSSLPSAADLTLRRRRSSSSSSSSTRAMTERSDEQKQPPSLTPRWFYAFEDGWQPFTDQDDRKLEDRWSELSSSGVLEKLKEQREQEKEAKRRRKAEAEKEKKDDEANEAKSQKKVDDSVNADTSFPWPPSGVDTIRTALFGASIKGIPLPKDASSSMMNKVNDEDNDDGKKKKVVSFTLDPDEPTEERKTKVEVMEDNLFDVDVASMELFPVFWKGVMLRVVRAHWFYLSNDGGFAPIPYDEALSSDLDEAYDKVKPWQEEDHRSSSSSSAAAEPEYLPLPSMSNNGRVQFDSATSGRIVTQDLSGKFLAVLGGSVITRGWEETERRSEKARNTSIFSASFLPWAGGQEPNAQTEDGKKDAGKKEYETQGSQRVQKREGAAKVPNKPEGGSDDEGDGANLSEKEKDEQNQGWLGKLWPSTDGAMSAKVNLLQKVGWSKESATEEGRRSARQENTEQALRTERKEQDETEEEEGAVEEDDESAAEEEAKKLEERADEPPELVLCIHGIGQKLVDDFEALDFVYDVERLRNLCKTNMADTALKQVSRGKRAQFLPVCWRKDLSFDDVEALDGNDNVYGLRDITNDATIPMVRTVISKLILDVPYYLSRHKETMIEAVVSEVNRIYRLFVRRNPDFEQRGGRVSLICHSLGSALAADILSRQPTNVPSLREQTDEQKHSKTSLAFNVRNLFFVGSPNGFFFHLHGAQLIARRGTARTQNEQADAASDEVGRLGCMAAESVYNCFNATDPVSFLMSATVDRAYARMLRPISIPDAVPALMKALAEPKLMLSKYFAGDHPFSKVTKGTKEDKKQHARSTSTDEVGKPVLLERGSASKVEQVAVANKQRRKEDGGDGEMTLERLQRAERRFRALNPHGCVDFVFVSGGVNEYFDMLSAHVSYWSNKPFALFVLTQLFSEFAKNDRAPTIVPSLADAKRVEGGEQKEHREKDDVEKR